MKHNEVILVTPQDVPIGIMDKMEAHKKGLLHRAFSVFIFDKEGKMLLQQRAADKYHGGLLWTNACCSHPYPDEHVHEAAERRLNEELGFTTSLEKIFWFIYKAEVENNLIEHEFDHVFVGEYEGEINFNIQEVAAFSYCSVPHIQSWMHEHPDKFTSWFKIALPKIESWWHKTYKVMSN